MSALIREYIEEHRESIERTLRSCLPESSLAGADDLNRAIEYAVFPGGRRMRPILTLLASEICGGSSQQALRAAAAVEFVHAASLAIDDLPCMDDAGLRRGAAAVHVLHGADLAILAALALLNRAYSLFAEVPGLLAHAVREIGASHMIGGQAIDLRGQNTAGRMEKTTSLTRLTMVAGAAAADAGIRDMAPLIAFGHDLGQAYQICDDLADVFDSDESTGKTSGQDCRHGRGSAVSNLGPTRARARAADLIDQAARDVRAHFGPTGPVEILVAFAQSVVPRDAMAAL
jgi:geranylgeranyl pyrophosphate synthase